MSGILFIVGLPVAGARASTYDVSVCGLGNGAPGTADGITSGQNGGTGYMDTLNLCSIGSPLIVQDAFVPAGYSSFTWNGDGHWDLTAPAGTTIDSLTMSRVFQGFQSWFTWDLTVPDGRLIERFAGWGNVNSNGSGIRTYRLNSPSVRGRFYCAVESCSGTGTSVVLSGLTARINDPGAPVLTTAPGGSLLAGGPLRGIKGVSINATDIGSGIYKVGLLVDGRNEQLQVPDTNGGRCVKPFQYLVPCKLSVNSAFTVDTAKIPDGDHEVQAVAYDATEEGRAVSSPTTVKIDNVPDQAPRPARIRLRITPRRTSNMHAIHWRGRVIGGKLPRRGATVLAQVKQGRGWIVFRQIRTNAAGRFRFDYRFHATTVATTYAFRVALAHGSVVGQAKSKTIKVRVEP